MFPVGGNGTVFSWAGPWCTLGSPPSGWNNLSGGEGNELMTFRWPDVNAVQHVVQVTGKMLT